MNHYENPNVSWSPPAAFGGMKTMTGGEIRRKFGIKVVYSGQDTDLNGKPLDDEPKIDSEPKLEVKCTTR